MKAAGNRTLVELCTKVADYDALDFSEIPFEVDLFESYREAARTLSKVALAFDEALETSCLTKTLCEIRACKFCEVKALVAKIVAEGE